LPTAIPFLRYPKAAVAAEIAVMGSIIDAQLSYPVWRRVLLVGRVFC